MLDRIPTLPAQEASDEEELTKYITAAVYGGEYITSIAFRFEFTEQGHTRRRRYGGC